MSDLKNGIQPKSTKIGNSPNGLTLMKQLQLGVCLKPGGGYAA